ncbi:MAG: O-antigen ligase family protein [Pseudomonadota bacterium]
MKIRLSIFFYLVVIVGTIGFPVLATTTAAVGIDNTLPSIVMRTAGLVAAMILVVKLPLETSIRFAMLPMLLTMFWAVYLARLFNDTHFFRDALAFDSSKYWIFALGASFIPMMSLVAYRGKVNFDSLLKFVFVFCLVFLPIALALSSTIRISEAGVAYYTGRSELPSLNPISFGQFGGVLVIISYWALRMRGLNRLNLLLLLVGLAIGTYCLMASGSRGPLVAVFVTLIVFEVTRKNAVPVLLGAMLLIMFMATIIGVMAAVIGDEFLLLFSKIDEVLGISLLSRFATLFQLSDASSSARVQLFFISLDQFLDHPLIGDFIEVREPTDYPYPHNIVLEALIATGLLGTIPLLIVLGLAFKASLFVIRNIPSCGWVSLLFLQQLVAVQFSGNIYGSSTFWVALGLLVVTTHSRPMQAKSHLDFATGDTPQTQ